jgi:predicted amidohydrolase
VCQLGGNNRSGEECSYRFSGDSRVVGPRHETHVFIDSEIEEAYAAATIELDDVRRKREELQLIQCRVPQA